MSLESLARRLEAAKRIEATAKCERMAIEEEIAAFFDAPVDYEGTLTLASGEYKVQHVQRINRRVDSKLLQEIAAEHGTSEHLANLFRWKPELNLTAWKQTSPEITTPLAAAITSKPGKPSIKIIKLENEAQ